MEEIKKIRVSPQSENRTVELWQTFGWKLMSSQEINNTDSHLERKFDGIYNVTTKENYINLLFKRDTDMPNYKELVELERAYASLEDVELPDPPVSMVKVVLVAIVEFVSLLICGINNGWYWILIGVALAAAIFLIGSKISKSGRAKFEAAEAESRKVNQQRKEIKEKARSLL